MLRFIIRRVLLATLTLSMVSVITFGLFFAIPPIPPAFSAVNGAPPSRSRRSATTLDSTTRSTSSTLLLPKGFSSVVPTRTAPSARLPVWGLMNLGGREVTEVVKDAFPITASLAVGAWILQLTLGIGLGMIAAVKRGKLIDKFAVGVALVGAATPIYFFGAMLLVIFRYETSWLPQPSYTSPFESLSAWFVACCCPGLPSLSSVLPLKPE